MSLSERIRSGCEAAPWVCEEVQHLEAINAELLEAAERIAARLEWHTINPLWNYDKRTTVIINQLRAAIAKAKGEQQ